MPRLWPFGRTRQAIGTGALGVCPGPQVAKFLNGICMAYWPASIAEAAYAGAKDIFERLAERRKAADSDWPLSRVALDHFVFFPRFGVH